MAYVSFAEDGVAMLSEVRRQPSRIAGFSPLEWSVVALAERDPLSSLRKPGRIAIALGGIFGYRHNQALADARLEALRRAAVLTWCHGGKIASYEVKSFLKAGFTVDQYETLVSSIGASRFVKRV